MDAWWVVHRRDNSLDVVTGEHCHMEIGEERFGPFRTEGDALLFAMEAEHEFGLLMLLIS